MKITISQEGVNPITISTEGFIEDTKNKIKSKIKSQNKIEETYKVNNLKDIKSLPNYSELKKRYDEFINKYDLTPIKSEADEDYKQYFDSIKKKLPSKYIRNLSFYSIDNMSFLTFEDDVKFDKTALTIFAALIGWIAVSTITPPEGYTDVKFMPIAKAKNNKIKLNKLLNYSVFLKK